MGSSVKNVTRGVLGVATGGLSEVAYAGYKAMKGAGGSADNAYQAQAAALQQQIDAMKSSAEAQTTVQVSNNPGATQQNVAQNAQLNAANEEALRRRRVALSSTYNNASRLYGALTGKSVLGG